MTDWNRPGVCNSPALLAVIMAPDLEHFLIILLLGIFLILVSKTSKILFSVFIIYINIVNIFQANIAIHWGGYTGDLSPRISTALLSPTYETLEYLREYVNTEKKIAIISHAGSLKALTSILLGIPSNKMWNLPTPKNTALIHFDIKKNHIKMIYYNNIDHLKK